MDVGEWDEERVRQAFPGAMRPRVYLDTATHGLASSRALEAVEEVARIVGTGALRSATEDVTHLMGSMQRARVEVATLIGATADEIALVESTTHGLKIAAEMIAPRPGERVLIDTLEFMGVAVPWCHLASHRGFEVVPVPHQDGAVTPEMFMKLADERTRAIVLSSVQEVNGWRTDLATLARFCRQHDIWLVVDGIQHVGALRFDVRELGVDVLACGGHKWLTSPFGTGFLYVRRERLEAFEPALRGYLSVVEPAEGWDRFLERPDKTPFKPYRFAGGASKLEVGGTPNFAGIRALEASVALLNSLGRERIDRWVRQLADELARGLEAVGATVVSPRDDAHCSGIVVFTVPGGLERMRELKEALLDERIQVSLRHNSGVGGIRASVHLYNTREDVRKLVEQVDRFLSSRRKGT